MTRLILPAFLAIALGAVGVLAVMVPAGSAQRPVAIMAPDEARAELERASAASAAAERRAQRFARAAEQAGEAAQRAAREAAALAARIQATEAEIEAARARYSLAQLARARLAARLAERQQPLVRLTAALQTTARRPLALSALQPGSLKDLVHVRAVLASAVPQVRARTAGLRSELEEGRRLERRARRALTALRESEDELEARRVELAATERRQRLASRDARGNALREEERALALAENARDLDGLIDELDRNAALRRKLAALPGPVLRPAALGGAGGPQDADPVSAPAPSPSPVASGAPSGFQLPVEGRTLTGFGELRASGLRSKGLALGPAPGAQVVAPADGRIAFAGPYEGFGRIVIIEHPGGWSSLVTGLARIDAAVGEDVIGGAPLGVAGGSAGDATVVGIELREQGEPVNPLDYLQ
ncbi:MAG: peptidoglycan DD-metalloendopeptidase family protein [Erythrobacter sp.]|jgi:septal ring factor EnvC (AmiA/AmiB activator)|nr:peptidoglycan DD-metalloendopeptidase family protein [Erythrobacter sp.]